MPTEIELKLRLPPDCAVTRRLQRHPLLKSLGISSPVTQKLHSVYYDTPNLDLQRLGVALRLRRVDKRWVQTIKGGGSVAAGLHQRGEWEAPVLKQQPDFTKITDPGLITLFSSANLRAQLRPLFTTEFTRNTRLLRLADGSEAEFCLDRGKIVADPLMEPLTNRLGRQTTPAKSLVISYPLSHEGREELSAPLSAGSRSRLTGRRGVGGEVASEPLCEIELELKAGNHPGQLFQLALELLNDFPLRLENASKAERGYALCCGGRSLPTKAMPVALDAETSVNPAFKAIAWSCLGHLHANESGMLAGLDIEYLHQMRVALRRLRSALSIFSTAFSKAALAPAAQELKWLLDQFGPARDWDVFVLETLAEVDMGFPGHPGLSALRKECERLRRRHNDAARAAVESARYTEMMLKFGAWLSEEPWLSQPDPIAPIELAGTGRADAPVQEFAQALLAKRHQQLKKHSKKLAGFNPEELHALRIAAKKQRYAAEFFAGLYPPRGTKDYIQSLSALQNILGAINDGATAKRLLDEVTIDDDGMREAMGIVLGWSASLAQRQKLELEQAWKRYGKQEPFWTTDA